MLILVVIAIIVIFVSLRNNKKSEENEISTPDQFYSRQCGGVPALFKTRYYREGTKYYSVGESPFIQSLLPIEPQEITIEEYTRQYKESIKPC